MGGGECTLPDTNFPADAVTGDILSIVKAKRHALESRD